MQAIRMLKKFFFPPSPEARFRAEVEQAERRLAAEAGWRKHQAKQLERRCRELEEQGWFDAPNCVKPATPTKVEILRVPRESDTTSEPAPTPAEPAPEIAECSVERTKMPYEDCKNGYGTYQVNSSLSREEAIQVLAKRHNDFIELTCGLMKSVSFQPIAIHTCYTTHSSSGRTLLIV